MPLCHHYLGFENILWSVNRQRLARESTANIWWKFCHVLGTELLNAFLFSSALPQVKMASLSHLHSQRNRYKIMDLFKITWLIRDTNT